MCTVEISDFHLRIIMLLITTHRTLTLSDLKFTPWIRIHERSFKNLYRRDTCNSYTYLHSWIYISFSFQTFKLIYYQTFLSNTCKPILPMGRDTCTTNLIPQYLINCLHFQFKMLNTNKRLLFITPLTDIKENL